LAVGVPDVFDDEAAGEDPDGEPVVAAREASWLLLPGLAGGAVPLQSI
jgi:hypothetical protein